MTKFFVVLTISLAVLMSFNGCAPTEPESAEPSKPEPVIAEPPAAKPSHAEAPKAEIPAAEPAVAEAPRTEPAAPELSADSFNDKCAPVLSRFVDEKGLVNYKELKRNRLELKKLLDEFDNLDPKAYERWSKEDKIAFWINAYNIQMLNIITDNYPIESSRWLRVIWPPTSIRHIPPVGVIGAPKWDNYKFIVMDEEFTLSEIENRFFFGQFNEPRVVFALLQASLSGPPLRNEPYCGSRLYEQLDNQVKKFLSSASDKGLRIDRANQKVYISSILDPEWYGKAFVSKYGIDRKFKDQPPIVRAVLNFICNYIPEQDISFLETANYSVRYITYDWRLNE